MVGLMLLLRDSFTLKGKPNVKKVLHVFKENLLKPKHSFLGSTKDVRGRTEYFMDRKILFEEITCPHDADRAVLEELKKRDLSGYQAIIFENLIYPRSLNYLKKNFPQIKTISRSINCEFYHQLHYAFACSRLGRFRESIGFIDIKNV